MKRSERARLARMTLDFRFQVGGPEAVAQRPTRGWIRAVRDALGMTSRQLGLRMRISQPAVAQLERSEAAGVIQLDTLRRAADALECDLVYAFVPRTTLTDTVRTRAEHVARQDIAAVDLTMRLDEKGLDAEQLQARTDDYASALITAGRLWEQ